MGISENKKTCFDCDFSPICKMYEMGCYLINIGRENNVNLMGEESEALVFELLAKTCQYYKYHKEE